MSRELEIILQAPKGDHDAPAPGKGWNVILRLYDPLEPWFDPFGPSTLLGVVSSSLD